MFEYLPGNTILRICYRMPTNNPSFVQALLMLYFYRSVENQRLLYWVLVGLFGGLAFMTKYFSAALFLSLLGILIFTRQGRASWKHKGVYIAVLIALGLSIPNLYWLYENDLIAFRYALERANLSEKHQSTISPLPYFRDAFFSADRRYSQWISEKDLHEKGALLVWSGEQENAPDWIENFAPLTMLPTRTYPRAVPAWFKKIAGEPKTHRVSAALLAPLNIHDSIGN